MEKDDPHLKYYQNGECVGEPSGSFDMRECEKVEYHRKGGHKDPLR